MKARLVSVRELSFILVEDWVDNSRRPYVENGLCYVPVKSGYAYDCVIPEKRRYIGRGYQHIGNTVLFHGKRPSNDEVDSVCSYLNPKAVIWIKNHSGIMRKPDSELLYGTPGDVIHREAGIVYHLDPMQVMFSQGNREEKLRIEKKVVSGERVADMFAGIGYFTLHMARAGADVHAMEINPVSFSYLLKNMKANGFEPHISAGCGDCRCLLFGIYDRIMMGHFDAVSFLSEALFYAKAGTVIHLHAVGDRDNEIHQIISDSGYKSRIDVHKVKKFSPHRYHVVYDILLI